MQNPSTENENRHSIWRKLAPGLVLGFLVLIGLSLLGDLRQVGELMVQFNWWIFPAALMFTLINYTLRFIKWHFYVGQIGARDFDWRQSLRLFLAGFPLAVSPGKVAEVLKAVWLRHYTGVPVARGVSVVVAERISDGLAVLLLSTVGVIAYPQYWVAFLIILVGLLAVIIVSQIRPAAQWLLGQGERIRLISKAVHHLREFYEGSFMLFKPKATFLAVGLGMVSWFGEGIGFYLLLLGLGLPAGIQLFGLAVFTLSFSTVVGAVSALPGGLGAAEASIAGMLILLGGFDPATAAAATLLIRLATFWFSVVLGLCTWTISADLLGMQKNDETAAQG